MGVSPTALRSHRVLCREHVALHSASGAWMKEGVGVGHIQQASSRAGLGSARAKDKDGFSLSFVHSAPSPHASSPLAREYQPAMEEVLLKKGIS